MESLYVRNTKAGKVRIVPRSDSQRRQPGAGRRQSVSSLHLNSAGAWEGPSGPSRAKRSVSANALQTAYALFGGVLQSEILLPALTVVDSDRADWVARVVSRPVGQVTELLGEERVDDRIKVRSSKLVGGFRLEFDDTGIFDITDGGATITWCPAPEARSEAARADLLGGVFSVALQLQGVLCLHGSGVSIHDKAVGFLAPKGSGKSTLALALTEAGSRLITDEMLAVHPGPPAMAWPSAPTVHLLEDSAQRLKHLDSDERNPSRGKYRVTNLRADQVATQRAPLAAIYELRPRAPKPDEPAVQRTRLAETAAVMTLLRHLKIGESVARLERMATFDRSARVARHVPVYQLEFTHEFDRLPQVLEQVMAWHAGEETSPDAA